jgi:hypothetical protein
LNATIAHAIRQRQQRAAEVGEALRALADPKSQTRLDPLRVVARHKLGKAQGQIDALLRSHGDAFSGPDEDPHTVSRAVLGAGDSVASVSALPAAGGEPRAA